MTARGSRSAAVELAGHRFLLRGPDDAWQRRILARYEGFIVEAGDDPFVVDVAAAGTLDPAAIAAERLTPPAAAWEGDKLRLGSTTFEAEADLDMRHATVTGPPLAYPVDALLRFLLAALLDDGLLVHAALLVEGDRSWLATGPSGSGKSTLAALLPERAAADELAAVRLRAGDVAVGHGLPFWRGRRTRAPLAGIYVLRHGRQCRRTRLDPKTALRRLAPEVMWPIGPPGQVDLRLTLATELISKVPAWELEFRPEAEVWDTIAGGDDR